MPDVRLIALDLDGTLLNSEKQLSPENAEALSNAAKAGIEIVPATGRFYRAIPEVIRALPFVHYVISVNGAEVYDVARGEAVCRAEIPWQRAVEVMELFDTLPVIYDCYQNGWGWMTKDLYDQAEQYTFSPHTLSMIRTFRTPVPDLKALIRERASGVQKVLAFFRDMDFRAKMLKTLPKELPDLVVTTSIQNNIEVNSREATKGNALRKLTDLLGLKPEQTMAFGDDLNDVTMLQEAGIGIAMGNAADEVKAAADFVTGSCNESGVALALKKYLA